MLSGELMDLAQVFLPPRNATHRQYEALRAYFVEQLSGPEVPERFGYTVGSLYQLVHQFRQHPEREFFAEATLPGRTKADESIRQRIIELRKQNQSIYDISEALKKEGTPRSSVAVSILLREEGFAKLPRRMDSERKPGTKPTAADVADARLLNLEPRTLRTKFGGLFLFLPALADLEFDRIVGGCDLPGTKIVPAPHAVRSLLALKVFGTIRQITVVDLGHEEPTLLLTNQMNRSATRLIERYARRMLIGNNIEDSVTFFHVDSLSSAVALTVNCDLQLTLMASSLYRHFGQKVGHGYEKAKSRHIFRDFIDATATIDISEAAIDVVFQQRTQPIARGGGFRQYRRKTDENLPSAGNKSGGQRI
jgi:transposase